MSPTNRDELEYALAFPALVALVLTGLTWLAVVSAVAAARGLFRPDDPARRKGV